MKKRYDHLLVERNFFRSTSTHLVVKGTILGEFHKSMFEYALEELRRIHPMLCCVIEVDAKSQISYVHNKEAIFPLTYLEKSKEDHWIEIVKAEENKPFRSTEEPPIRFFVLVDKFDFDLIIIGHHILGDGLSYAYVFQDFIDIYCNKKKLEVRETTLITSYKNLPEQSRFDRDVEEYIKYLNEEWDKERVFFSDEEYEKVYEKYHETNTVDVLTVKVENDDYHELRLQCKQNDVTINTLIFTVFLKAFQDLMELESSNVTIAMNIRNAMSFQPGRCIGNYASAFTPLLTYNNEFDIWENARHNCKVVSEYIKDAKKSHMVPQLFCQLDCSIIDALTFAASGSFMTPLIPKVVPLLSSISSGEGFGISNLGALNVDLSNSSYELTDFVYIPHATTIYNKTLGVATMNEQLMISILFKDLSIPRNTMEAVKNYVEVSLKELSQVLCTV